VISPTQRPLPDNTQHSQETDIHALGGIRTHNPSKRAAEHPRPTGIGDKIIIIIIITIIIIIIIINVVAAAAIVA
jgi:t-SNARE complex subunit (syntaxin)